MPMRAQTPMSLINAARAGIALEPLARQGVARLP